MAKIYQTTMSPTKLELLTRWLPGQPWYVDTEQPPDLTRVGGFRLDDPAGEVGIEFAFFRDEAAGGRTTYHIPMTYRGEPLPAAEAALIGTSEHGVLGPRWVYDGSEDPVLIAQVLALIQGTVEPQHQSQSDTVDTTVSVRSAEAADGRTGRRAGVHVVRVLSAESADRREDVATGKAALVQACWAEPDGSQGSGPVVVVQWDD